MHLLRSAQRQPRMETPVIFTSMHHAEACALLFKDDKAPIRVTYHILFQCVFISNKFPRLLAEREIIANAFISPDFSPNRLQRYNFYLKNKSLGQKKK